MKPRRHVVAFAALLFLFLSVQPEAAAQLSGTKTIPGDYATIALAIADLNASGVDFGGVTFDVAAGHTETSANLVITVSTATAGSPVVFQKSGVGANPLITAAPGISQSLDGIIKLSGTDHITFDGIDLLDPATNTGNEMMEWGYALLRASSTDGCQDVVIKNCTITLQKNNVVSSSIFSIGLYVANRDLSGATVNWSDSLTGPNVRNRFFGNSITNVYRGIQVIAASGSRDYDNEIGVVGENANTITNWGGGAQTADGIRCEGQINVKICNNIINGGTGTASGVNGILATLFGSGANIPNYEISYNEVTVNPASSSSGTYAIRALATADTVRVHHNIVENSTAIHTGTSTFNLISHEPSGTSNVAYIHDNIVRNNSHSGTGTGAVNCLFTSGTITTLVIHSNQVYGNQKTAASGILYGIKVSGTKVACYANNVYNNSMPNSSGTSASSVYGYYESGTIQEDTVYNNNIYNLSVGGTNTATTTVVYGIYSSTTATASKAISGNTVYGLSSNIGNVVGIYAWYGTSMGVYRNNIYNLSTGATNNSNFVAGIYSQPGTSIYVYNNFISDLRAASSTNPNAVIGIHYTATADGHSMKAYYNSIYLNGTSSNAGFGSSGISSAGSTTPTAGTLDLRNNIVVNQCVPTGSGLTVAMRRTNINLANYSSSSNNNCFYAGTPSASNLIYYDGTNSDQSLASYQARVAPRDVASFSTLPPFVNVGGTPYDLHLQTGIATQCESGGTAVTSPISVTTDYDGQPRFGDPGYTGGGSAPDVGADELEGVPLVPMAYVSSTTTQNTNAVFANTVNNHIIGIEIVTTGVSSPLTVTGFKFNTNGSTNAAVDISNAKVFYTGTSGTFGTSVQFGSTYPAPPPSPTPFVISGSQVLTNGTNYFWLAYDVPQSATGGNVIDGEVDTITVEGVGRVPTIKAPAGNRSIIAPLSGVYAVSPAQPYPFNTFNNVASLLGSAGVAGPVTLNVQAGSGPYNEQVIFDSIPGASSSNTVTINGNGETLTYAPTSADRYLIRLNGTKYLTIDSLNLVGTDASYGWGIHLINQANYNTIRKCTIDLSAVTSTSESWSVGIVATNSTTINSTAGDNANYCTFVGNTIKGGSGGGPWAGIRLNGNAGGANGVRNQIIGNVVADFYYEGITLSQTDSTLVRGNDIHRSNRAVVTAFQGVTVEAGCKNTLIEKNRIHTTNAPGANPSATAYGIYLLGADALPGDENVVVNNMLYNFNSVSGTTYGIYSSGSDGARFYSNSISLDHAAATGGATRGFAHPFTATNVEVRNNIISITRGGTGIKYALYLGSPVDSSDYNDIHVNAPAGTNSVGYVSSTSYATLAAWQTASGGLYDQNSVDGDPLFSSLSDLHITNPTSPASNTGTPIATVTDDFDGDPRDLLTPDIGADELGSTTSINVAITSGWNMISNPVTDPIPGDSVKQLFPTSINQYAFEFVAGSGYQQRFKMANGKGYWGKFPSATSNSITGTPRTQDSLSVVTGWNMVGTITTAVDTNTIVSVPPGLRGSNWFGYSAGYTAVTQLVPGKGYWVKSNGTGKFVLTASPVDRQSKVQAAVTGGLDALNTLTITDARGGSQTLYFGVDGNGEIELPLFEMPPAPPAGVFDARFETADGGLMVQTHTAETEQVAEFPITVQAEAYPLTVSWQIKGGQASYVLADGVDGEVFAPKSLAGEGELTISNPALHRVVLKLAGGSEVPAEYALWQNYPNPFNPTTNIKFALPVQSRVTVEVYNIIGQRVRTLVNGDLPAAYHVVEWNGTGNTGLRLGSGVYFVRLSADGTDGRKFTEVRKLTMLK